MPAPAPAPAYADLEPRNVFAHFAALSAIPRGSRDERRVSDHIAAFARDRGLPVEQDDMANLLIRKPGTPGYERAPALILHGHMDMICAKTPDSTHDFATDGIRLVVDGDFVCADDTSLGADNGIGVSFIMALLASDDIPHPPLEAVLTVMEEMGKAGIDRFDTSRLSGTRMVDFNWITDRQILAGCAGDISCTLEVPAEWQPPSPGDRALRFRVSGLQGGHCEFDIHLERANAIRCAARLHALLFRTLDVRVAGFSGGAQNNVIPASAELTLLLPGNARNDARRFAGELEAVLRAEYAVADPGLRIEVSDRDLPERCFSPAAGSRLCRIVALLPDGVLSMSRAIDGLVESSSNLGTVRDTAEGAILACTITAGITSRKHEILDRMRALADLAAGGVRFRRFGLDAPEFPHRPDSPTVAAAVDAYRHVHGEAPEVLVSNCSLELGFLCARIPGLDTVGIGTELHHLHSPRERVGHASVERSWRVVRDFVGRLRH